MRPEEWVGKTVCVPPVLRRQPEETALVRYVDGVGRVALECSAGGWLRGVPVVQLLEVVAEGSPVRSSRDRHVDDDLECDA